MGVVVHKVRLLRLLLLAVVLCVLSGLLLVTQSEENRQYVWSIGTQASSQKDTDEGYWLTKAEAHGLCAHRAYEWTRTCFDDVTDMRQRALLLQARPPTQTSA